MNSNLFVIPLLRQLFIFVQHKNVYKVKKILYLFIVAIGLMAFKADSQVFRTQLKVTVIDDAGNFVEGAHVVLFKTMEDYKAEKNPATEKLKTDSKGVVKFDNLEAKVYFVLAEKGDMNNWGGGVETDLLVEKKVNKVNIIIE